MSLDRKIRNSTLRLIKGDITDLEVEAFVFYARSDLKLGSGYGNAIAVRGGPSIKKELDELAPLEVGEAVITSAGNMKAKYIIHAVGPKFQEVNTEDKLRKTLGNILRLAEEKGIKQLALPPLGTGFYGIPLPVCAEIMLEGIQSHLKNASNLQEVIICALDTREYVPFQKLLENLK
jgi:O-acetyl-ADP-ribose deacetylase (regulator of RNase III)